MKCPKCRYISFDYNQVCPMCRKDLTGVRNVLDLPDYKPDAPFLLGILTGDVNDSEFEPEVGALTDITGIEGEDLEIHLETEIPEEPIEPSSAQRDVGLYSQENDSQADSALQETSSDGAEMVTSRIERKKGRFQKPGSS